MLHPTYNQILPNQSYFEEQVNGIHFRMIKVEGGLFDMGSEAEDAYSDEKPVHPVKLSDYCIGQFPVTQALWEAVMGNNPSFFRGKNRPVESVSWEECRAFCSKLSEITGKKYALPTEAQWEYAARGGKYNSGYQYAGSNFIEEVAWYIENSHNETKPVGLKYPNELGIYDLSGNVYEWCSDWYEGTYYEKLKRKGTVEDPKGPESGVYRVIRGGSWVRLPEDLPSF